MATSAATRSRQPQGSLHSEDAIAVRAAELAAWAKRNARMIITAAVIALVLVGGFLYYRVAQTQRQNAAAERFLALRQNLAVTTAAGSRELEQFIQSYDGTLEADEARLLLGQVRLAGGQARQAVTPLQPLAESDSPLAAQAAMLMGAAYAQQNDRPNAIRWYDRAAEAAEPRYLKFEALGQAALMHEQAGNYAAAVTVYERMLAETERGTLQETLVQMRLAEARGQVRAATPAR